MYRRRVGRWQAGLPFFFQIGLRHLCFLVLFFKIAVQLTESQHGHCTTLAACSTGILKLNGLPDTITTASMLTINIVIALFFPLSFTSPLYIWKWGDSCNLLIWEGCTGCKLPASAFPFTVVSPPGWMFSCPPKAWVPWWVRLLSHIQSWLRLRWKLSLTHWLHFEFVFQISPYCYHFVSSIAGFSFFFLFCLFLSSVYLFSSTPTDHKVWQLTKETFQGVVSHSPYLLLLTWVRCY